MGPGSPAGSGLTIDIACLERQGQLERDAENSYLSTDSVLEDPLNQLLVTPSNRGEIARLQINGEARSPLA